MSNEETLDPENWDELRTLGHRMLDDMINHQRDIAKIKQAFPTETSIKQICTPLTEDGEGEQAVYEVFRNSIQPHISGSAHPRFWGAVGGTGSPYGMLTSMLNAGLNYATEEPPSVAGYTHKQVIEWIKDLLNYPKEAGGVLVSGGSEANYTGLAVARNACSEVDMKACGMQDVPRRMTMYVSEGGHHCLDRSVELLGIGGNNLRRIETGDDFRIKLDSLEKAIKRDRDEGYHPFCIIGNAGTVDTGAFDDFNVLANIAAREKMWLHIDAAFGGWVKISKTHRHLADGLERADSVAIDLHKWMYMPYGIGCALVRDRVAHYSTFAYGHDAQYIKAHRDLLSESDQLIRPDMLALPLSREWRSLKAYMLLRAYGRGKYGRLIQQNLDQAKYLADLVKDDPDMELTTPVASNVVCFRFNPGGLNEDELDKLNRTIINDIYKVRFWMISDTVVKGRFTLRAAITNHRSKRKDFDYIFNLVKEVGHKHFATLKKF